MCHKSIYLPKSTNSVNTLFISKKSTLSFPKSHFVWSIQQHPIKFRNKPFRSGLRPWTSCKTWALRVTDRDATTFSFVQHLKLHKVQQAKADICCEHSWFVKIWHNFRTLYLTQDLPVFTDSGLDSKDLKLTCDLQNNDFVPLLL